VSAWVSVVELSGINAGVLDSFRHCELVESVEGFACYERVLRFRMSWTADDAWYVRPRRDADVDDAGRPGAIAVMDQVMDQVMDSVAGLWLDVADDWDVDARQIRAVTTSRATLAMDGYEHLMVAVLGRDRSGGQIRLQRRDDARAYWEGTVGPGQALVVDPGVGAVLAAGPGRLDLLVNGFARSRAATGVTAAGPLDPPPPPDRR
jgi:hypothetical protein